MSLCTCICFFVPVSDPLYVYKRPSSRPRNSKRVLFCTNTSRRRTCLFSSTCSPRSKGEYPISKIPLSPEQSSYNCDLAIRVTTTRNILYLSPITAIPSTLAHMPMPPPASLVLFVFFETHLLLCFMGWLSLSVMTVCPGLLFFLHSIYSLFPFAWSTNAFLRFLKQS